MIPICLQFPKREDDDKGLEKIDWVAMVFEIYSNPNLINKILQTPGWLLQSIFILLHIFSRLWKEKTMLL